MNILITGGGKQVYYLCRDLAGKGYKVTVINKDREECRRFSRRLKRITIVCGDPSDPRVLEDAVAGTMDVVLAVTSRDEDNLAIAQLSALRFETKRIYALANDPDNEAVFRALGVPGVFSLTPVMANLIEERVGFPELLNMIPLDEGKVNITEIVLGPKSPVLDKPLRDVALPPDCLVACAIREEAIIVPRGDTALKKGDRIILIAALHVHDQAVACLTGSD